MNKIYDFPVNVRVETAAEVRRLAHRDSLNLMAVTTEAIVLYGKKYAQKRAPAERRKVQPNQGGKSTIVRVSVAAGALVKKFAERDGRALYQVMQESLALYRAKYSVTRTDVEKAPLKGRPPLKVHALKR